jgi:hypothetical protein
LAGTREQDSRDLLLWFFGPAGPEYRTPFSVDASVTLVTISRTGIAVCSKEFRGATAQPGRKKYELGIGGQLFHDKPPQEFRAVSGGRGQQFQEVSDTGLPPTMATLTVVAC